MTPRQRSKRKATSGDVRQLIRRLDALKMEFGPGPSRAKRAAIRSLRRSDITHALLLLEYHDVLCVLFAYPDDSHVRSAAEAELKGFGRRVQDFAGSSRARLARLQDSGMASTDVIHPFSYDIAHRLSRWQRGRVDVDWEELDGEGEERIISSLAQLVTWPENDSIDYDTEFDLRAWLRHAAGRHGKTDLEVLLELLSQSPLPLAQKRYLYDRWELSLRLRLRDAAPSRTRQRLPSGRTWYQWEPRKTRSASLREEVVKPAAALKRVSASDGRMYLRALQEAQAVRNRELFPIVHGNPHEVYRYDPGRGFRFVIFGMVPEMRLPFESNFGGLLIRNGMPVGYAIAAPWFDRTEIAINIFPAFRSGESAFVFEQFCRLMYRHFGSRAFFVRSHQMGEDDEEPLLSGAFWFYYKLGFRAVNPVVYRRAEREAAKLKQRKGYRCSLATLKSLSHTDVYLHVDPERQANYREAPLVPLAYAVTRYLARAAHQRDKAQEQAIEIATRVLGIRGIGRWSQAEVMWLRRWAPLVASLPGLRQWSSDDRRDLAGVIRAKGAPRERGFVRRCIRHPRLRDALERLAARPNR